VADNNHSFESFLSSLNFTNEYLQRFKDTGFDDMELLKSLNTDELQRMFNLIGLTGKPGHLMKFKKALIQLQPLLSKQPSSSTPAPLHLQVLLCLSTILQL
jgi:hypothetical protein